MSGDTLNTAARANSCGIVSHREKRNLATKKRRRRGLEKEGWPDRAGTEQKRKKE